MACRSAHAGGASIPGNFQVDGKYEIQVRLARDQGTLRAFGGTAAALRKDYGCCRGLDGNRTGVSCEWLD